MCSAYVLVQILKIFSVSLMSSLMRSVINLILLSVSVGVIAGPQNPDIDSPTESQTRANHHCNTMLHDKLLLPLDRVKLRIIVNDERIFRVDMKRTKRILANEHLPVWILRGVVDFNTLDDGDGHELERDHEVMNQLGEFTTYHDPETSSAAVYFHKRRELDGMIGYEFLIHKLSIDYIRLIGETSLQLDHLGVYRRPDYIGHIDDQEVEDPAAGVYDQGHMKTYEGHIYDGYPEVLVIVSWDVVKYLTCSVAEADRHSAIVSNVITLINGIDMLYSKLQKTKIQINIAAIIIGTDKESFHFLDECYHTVTVDGKSRPRLGGRCANTMFTRYLNARKEKIPIDSYDMALFFTREKLIVESHDNSIDDVTPLTFTTADGVSGRIRRLYECRKQNSNCILFGVITTRGYLANYPTIAHEMAHLMTVSHDVPPESDTRGQCCSSLMKTSGEWCEQCLTWSDTSEETFNLFLSSPNCCTFINKPRSLNPPGRQHMLTADEQCRCYGYKSSRTYLKIPEIFCRIDLKCIKVDNEVDDTVVPLDGTLCDKNKVCWQSRCKNVQVSEQFDQLILT